jgi:hypothetical protein
MPGCSAPARRTLRSLGNRNELKLLKGGLPLGRSPLGGGTCSFCCIHSHTGTGPGRMHRRDPRFLPAWASIPIQLSHLLAGIMERSGSNVQDVEPGGHGAGARWRCRPLGIELVPEQAKPGHLRGDAQEERASFAGQGSLRTAHGKPLGCAQTKLACRSGSPHAWFWLKIDASPPSFLLLQRLRSSRTPQPGPTFSGYPC